VGLSALLDFSGLLLLCHKTLWICCRKSRHKNFKLPEAAFLKLTRTASAVKMTQQKLVCRLVLRQNGWQNARKTSTLAGAWRFRWFSDVGARVFDLDAPAQ